MAKGKLYLTNKVVKTRNFFIRTYLSEAQLKILLLQHRFQIYHYAYAYHDKDVLKEDRTDADGNVVKAAGELIEPHFHVILLLNNGNSVSGISRWFSQWRDSENRLISSEVEICKDYNFAFDYLTHETSKCLSRGDYVYDSDIIVSDDIMHFKGGLSADLDSAQRYVFDMFRGVSYAEMGMKYGRDFIMNIDRIRFYCDQVKYEGSFTNRHLDSDLDDVVRTVRQYEDQSAKPYPSDGVEYSQEHLEF